MRLESSVTSVSWIPSEAVTARAQGHVRGRRHALRRSAARRDRRPRGAGAPRRRFRFANHLAAWVEVEGGKIVDAGYSGGGVHGTHHRAPRPTAPTFEPVPLPDIRHEPEIGETSVRVRADHAAGAPASPRRGGCKHPPFVQFKRADGVDDAGAHDPRRRHVEFEVLGASKFPRHWVYDDDGKLAAKVGLANFKEWYRDAFGKHTPWGDAGLAGARHRGRDRARARALGHDHARRRASPRSARSRRASALVEQGEPGDELFLLLDGVLAVIDGRRAGRRGRARRRSSASGRCSKAASAPPRLRRRPRAGRGGVARPDRPRGAPRARARQHRARDRQLASPACASPPGTSTR